MSVEGDPSGGGIGGAVASVRVELASPTTFFESNMNIVSIIKAADVVMGPSVMVGIGSPILQQAEAVASAAWEKAGPDPAQLFFENNVRILSIMSIFSPQPELKAADAISEAESILAEARRPQIVLPPVEPNIVPLPIPKPELNQLRAQPLIIPASEPLVIPMVTPKSQLNGHTFMRSYISMGEKVGQQLETVREEEEIQSETDKRVNEVKIQRVVDESAIRQRVKEIIEAAAKAGSLDGEDIVQFLPSQHQQNRSGELNIVDPQNRLLDGSLLRMVKKIIASHFRSVADLFVKASKIVREDIPVTQGAGKMVTDQDVHKVYEPNKRKAPPAQQVIRRVVKMLKQVKIVKKGQQPIQVVPIDEQVSETNEGIIADLGLEQVLTDSNNLG